MFWLIKKSLKINTFLSAEEVQYKRKCQGGLAKLTGEGGGPRSKKGWEPLLYWMKSSFEGNPAFTQRVFFQKLTVAISSGFVCVGRLHACASHVDIYI